MVVHSKRTQKPFGYSAPGPRMQSQASASPDKEFTIGIWPVGPNTSLRVSRSQILFIRLLLYPVLMITRRVIIDTLSNQVASNSKGSKDIRRTYAVHLLNERWNKHVIWEGNIQTQTHTEWIPHKVFFQTNPEIKPIDLWLPETQRSPQDAVEQSLLIVAYN